MYNAAAAWGIERDDLIVLLSPTRSCRMSPHVAPFHNLQRLLNAILLQNDVSILLLKLNFDLVIVVQVYSFFFTHCSEEAERCHMIRSQTGENKGV